VESPVRAPLPTPGRSELVVGAPGEGPGWWAGGPSALLDDGTWWLAYRLRRPVGQGRGYANVVARSEDGVRFETACVLEQDAFDTESLERPALVRRPDGGWRLYVSCATEGTKHWKVVALDAEDPSGFDPSRRVTVLPGDELTAMKDPVVVPGCDGQPWRAWVCCHPLEEPGAEDRMSTRLATSPDGLSWVLGPVVLEGRPGRWDARGARVTSVQPGPSGWAYYDGRQDAAENWSERTGVAVAGQDGVHLVAVDSDPTGSPHGGGALRYVCAVPLPGGGYRLYYEAARPDGAHDLRTEVVTPRPQGPASR
jgi:hypothetical protein